MKHLLASAALGALVLATPMATTDAWAETPDDQLVIAMTLNNVLTLDPAAITGGETVQILNNVYDALAELNPETKELEPRIAESWEIAEDGMSVTFNLRDDVTFASGNPLTAEDVAWSMKRALELNLASASGFKSRGFESDKADEYFVAQDDHTFVLNLPQQDDPKLLIMTLTQAGAGSILDKELVLENEQDGDMGQAWLTNNSAGSGAYVLTDWRSNEHVILTRNENFWGDAPEMRRVLMRHMPESQSQRLALEQGDIDIGYSLSKPDLTALQDNPDVTVETVPSAGFYYLAVSMKDERFANRKVREALRYLIDYDGINTAIMPFFGVEYKRNINSHAFGVLPQPDYELDVEKAKALLAEAGYPDGFDTTIRVISTQQFLDSATAIQGTLAQAGIDAEIITGDGGQIYGAMRERDFELLVGRGGGGRLPHPDSNLRALAYNPDNSQDAGLTNFQGWRTSFYDEELNTMIENALIEGDTGEQIQMYHDIQRYMDELVMSIQPFSERVVTAAYQDDVDGVIVDVWTSRVEDVVKDR
ncbi:ABC transporter substrate-binding protein [Psychromarinibacter sp. C21-152]|uniref:ABC transporter substrate-binding protein n=1 Tax=Psychromarinibacter sediminicola TaxID=3033385 RepID=A0AAE3NQK3_9RHOB|nr:ABC transporter substrate-binding protein [Psychromarinibacter sediminicola]MDF0601708.1 ABC transporter substrate-binding protein [Psychromarinibacter sediminicola]